MLECIFPVEEVIDNLININEEVLEWCTIFGSILPVVSEEVCCLEGGIFVEEV